MGAFPERINKQYEYLYIHLPFCDVICHYCDFYTARNAQADHASLIDSIHQQIQTHEALFHNKMRAIYFGGGTPGVTPPELLEKVLSPLRGKISSDTEVTLEANPNNVTETNCKQWRSAGINRVSLGVQSLDDGLLRRLSRTHSARQALDSLEMCRKYFENVTGDLMYGIPGQTLEDPLNHAAQMLERGIQHLSAYHLTLNKDHFWSSKLPTDDFARAQIKLFSEFLAEKGVQHYEVSNFGQPGFQSLNNLNYWRGGAYFALGPSAHGFDGEFTRWKNLADWKAYIAETFAGNGVVAETEVLTEQQRLLETLFTGLRLQEGIELSLLESKFQFDVQRDCNYLLQKWVHRGWLKEGHSALRLTFDGRMMVDTLVLELIKNRPL